MADDLSDAIKLTQKIMGHRQDVGGALKAIRDQRLYREDFSDFDTYCAVRWQLTPDQVEWFIAGADGQNEDTQA